jgi:hypothetical protein
MYRFIFLLKKSFTGNVKTKENWRKQRLVVRQRPCGAPFTTSRSHVEVYFHMSLFSSVHNHTNQRFANSKELQDLRPKDPA